MVYDQKGKPIAFIPIESNRTHNDIHFFKTERLGQRVTKFDPKTKNDPIDWISLYGKVATTGVPELLETYCKPVDKWYQTYIYSPKKTFFISVFIVHLYFHDNK